MKVVILAGGSGTRLFPLSRQCFPKQFTSIGGEKSLLAQTIQRFLSCIGEEDIVIITNEQYQFLVRDILEKEHITKALVILEPVGKDGKLFPCYKFRSMIVNSQQVLEELLAKDPDAKAEWEANYKLKNDPRITKLGAFLRRTSLDELPQLFNVLRGEMSLVGPRPIVQEELDKYYRGYEGDYLSVKPGVTGMWQVSGRSDLDYDERVELDRWYVRNWSFWVDIMLLWRTVKIVVKGKGAY